MYEVFAHTELKENQDLGISIPGADPGFHNHHVGPRLPQPPHCCTRRAVSSAATPEPNSSPRAATEKPASTGVGDLFTRREGLEEDQVGVVSEQRAGPGLQRETWRREKQAVGTRGLAGKPDVPKAEESKGQLIPAIRSHA